MMSVKLENSGVALNRAALRGCRAFPGSAFSGALGFRPSTMGHLPVFPGQLLAGDATANSLAHSKDEAMHIVRVAIVIAKHLFVHVPEEVEGLNRNVQRD
jgi:hypothetical protein